MISQWVRYCLFAMVGFQLNKSAGVLGSAAAADDAEHAIIIDAGSAGSRVHVFRWSPDDIVGTLAEVCVKKIHPALSTFYRRKSELKKYLQDLTFYAEQCVAPKRWRDTPISLLATAGLRKMGPREQEWIVTHSRQALEAGRFPVGDVKVLSGEEEALFDWLAIVSVYRGDGEDVFSGGKSRGVVDMGGESKQIAFSVRSEGGDGAAGHSRDTCPPRWSVQLPSIPTPIDLFSRSYNGFGLISSMNIVANHYHDKWYNQTCTPAACEVGVSGQGELEVPSTGAAPAGCNCALSAAVGTATEEDSDGVQPMYHNPCYAPGVFPPGNSHDLDYDLEGSGNFSACLDLIREIFTPMIPEVDIQCMKTMRRQEPLVGIDGFPKIAEILDLRDDNNDGFVEISPSELLETGDVLCQRNWNDLHSDFAHYMPYRSQRACFGAVYIYYLLVDVYGIAEGDRHSFRTLGYENDVSWTVGAAMNQALSVSTTADMIPFKITKLD